jgi:lipopolysaccharide export system ATP-binding protein
LAHQESTLYPEAAPVANNAESGSQKSALYPEEAPAVSSAESRSQKSALYPEEAPANFILVDQPDSPTICPVPTANAGSSADTAMPAVLSGKDCSETDARQDNSGGTLVGATDSTHAEEAPVNQQELTGTADPADRNLPIPVFSLSSPVILSLPQQEIPHTDDHTGKSTTKNQQEHFLGVSDLHKRFGRKEIVKGVNFSMGNGEVAGLLGPNGAGKTTIFYMIVGFYKPSAGRVFLDDVDITSMPMYRRARHGIAYLPQEASIFRKMKVEQNIWAILESRKDINRAEKKQRLENLLDEFGIARIRKQYGYTLSGGERRRTEIARALATDPKFLLLDEPFAGIDPIAVFEIKQIIRRLAEKGIGILITDHNVRDTLEITTEAFIINSGTIVARGDRDSILNNEMVREVYLGAEFRM